MKRKAASDPANRSRKKTKIFSMEEVSLKYIISLPHFTNYLNKSMINFMALLPDDAIREILGRLNDHELRWARLINKHIFSIVNITHFTIGLIHDAEMKGLIRVFGRYNNPIGLSFNKPYFIKDNLSRLEQLTQLTSLDLNTQNTSLNISQLTNLQRVTVVDALPQIQRMTRLRDLTIDIAQINSTSKIPTQLERLVVRNLTLHERQESITYCPHLTKLALLCDFKGYNKLLKSMPNIRCLELTLRESIAKCHLTGLESLCTNGAITDLPVHTMTCLSVLENHTFGDTKWDIAHLTNLRRLYLDGKMFTDHLSLIPFTLLQSLTLNNAVADEFLTQLISSSITQLEISIRLGQHTSYLTLFTNLRQLSLKLESVHEFDFAHLCNLTQLTGVKVHARRLQNLSLCTQLTNLLDLVIANASINEGTSALCQLTRLTNLEVESRSPIVDLSNLTNLVSLQLEENYGREIIGLSTFARLTALKCSHTNVKQLPSLTALRDLHLSGYLRNRSLVSLSTLTRLTSLCVFADGDGAPLTRLTQLQKMRIVSYEELIDFKKKLINCHELECVNESYSSDDG
jgi:hypothetical protein